MNLNMQQIFRLFLLLLLLQACAEDSFEHRHIGVLWDNIHYPDPHDDPSIAWLEEHPEWAPKIIAVNNLIEHPDLSEFDVIWYHRPFDSIAQKINPAIAPMLGKFLQNGGGLLLTMDAVKLSYEFGWQTKAPQDSMISIEDNGFGRNYGFHGYLSHPIYDGMQTGAYTWHPKNNTRAHRRGYFGGSRPDNANVLGIQWSYITFHEEDVLVWEQPVDQGNILHVGAFIFPGEDQFNRLQHDRFLENCLRYLAKDPTTIKAFSWPVPDKGVLLSNTPVLEADLAPPQKWDIKESPLQMDKKDPGKTLWNVAGRRMLWLGKEQGGIDEMWAHPLLGLRDLSFGIQMEPDGEVIWLDSAAQRYQVRPESIVRTYQMNNLHLKDIVLSSATAPAGVWHWEWSGEDIYRIHIKANTRLRLMWPYSEKVPGSLLYSQNGQGLLHVTDPLGLFHTMAGFNIPPASFHSGKGKGIEYSGEAWSITDTTETMVSAYWIFEPGEQQALDMIIASGEGTEAEMHEAFSLASRNPAAFSDEALSYYEQLADKFLSIKGPDENFNKGYEWALVNTDKFMVETPGIGTTLMAGFSSTDFGWDGRHRISGRPGYAWYFGRDAAWSGFALNAYGDTESVKKVLEVFKAYQNLNGKIFHELTSSKVAHFDAADATPMYIQLMAHYLRFSGDLALVREHETSLKRAMEYLQGTDTDGDGFIENTNEGHGWVEGGPLYGAHTTFYLAGMWVAALQDYSYLMETLGNKKESRSYRQLAEEMKEKLNSQFWNEEKQFFNYGLWKDGTYNEERTVLPAVNAYFGVLDGTKAEATASQYIYNNFSTDWGIRLLGEESPQFNPRGYHYGSVWPLYTGWAALSEYAYGFYNQGFTHVLNNLNVYKQWDLGAVEEVLNGEFYFPGGVSRQQCWSETMVLQPISEGMLGLKPNAPENGLFMKPSLPWHWEYYDIRNIKMGNHTLDIHMEREENTITFKLQHSGKIPLEITFHPVLALGARIKAVTRDGKPLDYKNLSERAGLTLGLESFELAGSTTLVIAFEGGGSYVPQEFDPQPNDATGKFRILGERKNSVWEIDLEGLPESIQNLEVYSLDRISEVKGGQIKENRHPRYVLEVPMNGLIKGKYSYKTIQLYHEK
jgi:glycogen debranching enzyme